jgi:hypothetical protein
LDHQTAIIKADCFIIAVWWSNVDCFIIAVWWSNADCFIIAVWWSNADCFIAIIKQSALDHQTAIIKQSALDHQTAIIKQSALDTLKHLEDLNMMFLDYLILLLYVGYTILRMEHNCKKYYFILIRMSQMLQY